MGRCITCLFLQLSYSHTEHTVIIMKTKTRALHSRINSNLKTSSKPGCISSRVNNTEHHLHKACDQMQLLQARIADIHMRHQRALKRNQHQLCRRLKSQLSVLQGVYNMFYQYAGHKAVQLMSLELTKSRPESSDRPNEQMVSC